MTNSIFSKYVTNSLCKVTSALLPAAVIIAVGMTSGACSDSEEELGPSTGTCTSGKCDGFSSTVDDFFSDMKEIRLDDLVVVGMGLANEPINDALSDIPYTDIELSETKVFGHAHEVFGETIVHDINELQTGLTQALGEHAFATRINEIRQNFLSNAPTAVYAETHFKMGANLDPSWTVDAGGLPVTLGLFVNPEIETVLVAPYEKGEMQSVVINPLYTIRETRGFVLPRRLEDVIQMAPGEMVALRGDGRVGFNIGVGLPIYLTTVADFLTLRARISAGARVSMGGTVDAQLIRGDGMTAYVDVGLKNEQMKHFSLALNTGWGVEGLPEVEVNLGPVDVNLADIMENALEDLLNRKLALFSASASSGNTQGRLTVVRFKFDLGGGDSAMIEQALSQAMKGDLRLAQALANRENSGVTTELDISRDSRSEAGFLGFRFLGMSFYLSDSATQGVVQINNGNESQALFFTELEENSGFFFTERSHKWRRLVSLKSTDGRLTDAQVNARLVLKETDSYMERDQVLDHLDPLINYIMGFNSTFGGFGRYTDSLADHVDNHCGYPPGFNADRWEQEEYEQCVADIASTTEFMTMKEQAIQAFEDAKSAGITGGFDSEFMDSHTLASALFDVKLGISSIYEYPALWTGPKATAYTQINFSQTALDDIFKASRAEDFRESVEHVLWLMRSDREENDFDTKRDDAQDEVWDQREDIDQVVGHFQETAKKYEHFHNLVAIDYDQEILGDQAHLVLIPVNSPQDIHMASIAEHKGDLLESFFIDLVEAAGNLKEPEGFVLGYALLGMAWPKDIELIVNLAFDDDDYPQQDLKVYTRGTSAEFINAGLFNIEELF